MPIDSALIKWIIESYGLPAALAIYVLWKSLGKSETKSDVARELITKLDAISEKVDELKTVPVRLAIVETKIEALIK
jgi:hypothetical protein